MLEYFTVNDVTIKLIRMRILMIVIIKFSIELNFLIYTIISVDSWLCTYRLNIGMLLDASEMHWLTISEYDTIIMMICSCIAKYDRYTYAVDDMLNLLALSLMSWSSSIISTIEFPDAVVQLCWYKIRNGRLRSSYSVLSVH